MKTAYSYVRLSSKRQTKETATGTTRQLERAQAICKTHGWHLSHQTFQDLGVSGFKGKNRLEGALGEFISLAKDKKLGANPVLILEDFSRFSRQNIDEAEPAFIDLLKAGVDIHVGFNNKTFTKEDTKETASRIEILVAIKQAHDFSALLSSRVKSTQAIRNRKINSGEVVRTCNVPRYYKFDKATVQYVQTEAADTVKRLINDYLNGHSLYQISKALNTEGVPCIGYKPRVKWSRMAIKGILETKALYGAHQSNESFFTNPICSKDTFDKVQALLKQNAGNQGRFGSDYVNIFRGVIKCPVCGGSMSAGVQHFNSKNKKRKKQPYRYLRCSSVSNSMPCTNRYNINLTELEEEFFGNFILQDPRALVADTSQAENVRVEISKLQIEKEKISSKITKLIDADVSVPEMRKRIQELKDQRDKLEQSIDAKAVELRSLESAPGLFDDLKTLLKAVENEPKGLTYLDKNLKLHLSKDAKAMDDALHRLGNTLKDNATRMKLRNIMTHLVGKILVDTENKSFEVYNRGGVCVYKSLMGNVDRGVYEFASDTAGE